MRSRSLRSNRMRRDCGARMTGTWLRSAQSRSVVYGTPKYFAAVCAESRRGPGPAARRSKPPAPADRSPFACLSCSVVARMASSLAPTANRKSNNPVVLGFQGRSQLETRYGHDAEAMLSQPATKIFLRTSEPHAAKWISDTIGEIEIERLRESRSKGKYGQRSFGLERQVEPLVMPSEISGLPSLRGYLKLENLVVRLHFPFLELPARHPAFVEPPSSRRRSPLTIATTPARAPAPIIQSPVPETIIAHE